MNISFFLRIHFLSFSTVICFEFQNIILGFGIEVFLWGVRRYDCKKWRSVGAEQRLCSPLIKAAVRVVVILANFLKSTINTKYLDYK